MKSETQGHKPTHEQIAVRAYQLWEQQGRLSGKDLEYWLQAEKQLTGVQTAPSAATPARATTPAPAPAEPAPIPLSSLHRTNGRNRPATRA